MELFKARRAANSCVQNNGITLADRSPQLATFVLLASAWPIKMSPCGYCCPASLCDGSLALFVRYTIL